MSSPAGGSRGADSAVPDSPRVASLPFFYTAPIALGLVGILLVKWGALALSTPWSSLTLALTHTLTLGFLTMSGFGAFYALGSASGFLEAVRPRWSHVVYYSLVLGAGGLVWGTAQSQAGPVFFAIGAVGVMGVAFIVQNARILRRGDSTQPLVRGLRLALWGFGLAAFLGVWLAHGHGGMRFPGLRPLWMIVHLSIALLGWLGAMLVSASGVALPSTFGAAPLSGRALDWVLRGTALGIAVPFVLLLYGYFFVPEMSQAWIEPWAAASLLPAMAAIWLVHPFLCLRALRSGSRVPGFDYWRSGLFLAPVVLGVAVAAWLQADVRLGMLFGWLALFGWGATLFSGLLLGTAPGLLLASGPASRETRPVPDWLHSASRIGLMLHRAALGAGAVGILTLSDGWCRFTGGLVFVDGAWLLFVLVRLLLESRPERVRSA